jgi:purine-binding chemotaxis protein CheW
MMTTQHYLSFRIGSEWYGVELGSVIEVLHFMALTELPTAPPDVLGLMVLRDTVMPVVDLRLRFGLSDADLTLNTAIIAVRTPQGPMGMVVDDVDDVEQITEFVQHHETLSPYVNGVARLSARLLLLFDTALLRQHTHLPENRQLAEAAS